MTPDRVQSYILMQCNVLSMFQHPTSTTTNHRQDETLVLITYSLDIEWQDWIAQTFLRILLRQERVEWRRPHPDRISITVGNICWRAVSAEIQCKVNWPETDNNAPADARAQCFCNFSSHQWSSNWHNWFVFFYLTICTTQHRTSGSSAVGTGEPVILKLVRTLQWIK